MWLPADGLVTFSDGVCAFLGSGPSLFWLAKSKPFMFSGTHTSGFWVLFCYAATQLAAPLAFFRCWWTYFKMFRL